MNCSLLGSSVCGILQARILDGLPCPPPGDLPNPGIEPTSLLSLALAGGFSTTSTTWELQPPPQIEDSLQARKGGESWSHVLERREEAVARGVGRMSRAPEPAHVTPEEEACLRGAEARRERAAVRQG